METTESTDVVKLLEEVDFEKAAVHMKSLVGRLETEDLLFFYGRYKQARSGPCQEPKPSFFEFQAKQKWNAWTQLGNMSKEQAMQEYVDKMDEVDPGWLDKVDLSSADPDEKEMSWVTVSSLARDQRDRDVSVADESKTVLDWIKEGDVERVRQSLTPDISQNFRDENGLGLIHWAADRGVVDIVRLVTAAHTHQPGEAKSVINSRDEDGQTALHYACSNGHTEVVEYLLSCDGVDTTLRDTDGFTAEDIIDENCPNLRKLFHHKRE